MNSQAELPSCVALCDVKLNALPRIQRLITPCYWRRRGLVAGRACLGMIRRRQIARQVIERNVSES